MSQSEDMKSLENKMATSEAKLAQLLNHLKSEHQKFKMA